MKQINQEKLEDFFSFIRVAQPGKRVIEQLHATDIKTFLECRRKFSYSKIDRLKTQGLEAEYFTFGKSWHKVMASHYNKEDVEAEIASIDTSIYSDHRSHIDALYDGYGKQYPDDFSQFQIASIENEIHLNFHGYIIIFTLDFLAIENTTPNPIYVVMDHKAYSRFPNEELMKNDFQASFYLWACRKLGINVKKYILNCIKKEPPMMPSVLKNGKISKSKAALGDTEYDLYLQAIKMSGNDPAEYIEELKFLNERGSNTYKRYSARRTQTELDNFEEDLKAILDEMHNLNTRFYPIPQLTCPRCPFEFLCRTQNCGGDIEYTKKASFVKKEDDER